MKFLLLSMILYALGLPFYLRARRERGSPAFSCRLDSVLAAGVAALGALAIWSLAAG